LSLGGRFQTPLYIQGWRRWVEARRRSSRRAQRSGGREDGKRRAVLRRAARFTDWGVILAWPLGKSGFPRSWTPAF